MVSSHDNHTSIPSSFKISFNLISFRSICVDFIDFGGYLAGWTIPPIVGEGDGTLYVLPLTSNFQEGTPHLNRSPHQKYLFQL